MLLEWSVSCFEVIIVAYLPVYRELISPIFKLLYSMVLLKSSAHGGRGLEGLAMTFLLMLLPSYLLSHTILMMRKRRQLRKLLRNVPQMVSFSLLQISAVAPVRQAGVLVLSRFQVTTESLIKRWTTISMLNVDLVSVAERGATTILGTTISVRKILSPFIVSFSHSLQLLPYPAAHAAHHIQLLTAATSVIRPTSNSQ
jgi:hypothetical protein